MRAGHFQGSPRYTLMKTRRPWRHWRNFLVASTWNLTVLCAADGPSRVQRTDRAVPAGHAVGALCGSPGFLAGTVPLAASCASARYVIEQVSFNSVSTDPYTPTKGEMPGLGAFAE